MRRTTADGLRAAVRALGRRRRNDAVPLALRRRLVGYAQARRGEGRGWGTLARELGVASSTLQRWCATPRAPELRPVRVADMAAREGTAERSQRGLVVVTAAGHRVEGLDIGAAAALLRALGA